MSFKELKPQSLYIYNARLITRDSVIKKAWILLRNGRIEKIGLNKTTVFPQKAEIINACDNYLSPGFIDLHIHGNIENISQTQMKSGTTGFLLGLHADKIERLCSNINFAKTIPLKGARCLGFHLEGPFLNKTMAGAQPKKHIIKPNLRQLNQLLKYAGKDIKIMTLSCDAGESFSLIKQLKKNHIIAGLGHTNASFEQAKRAVECGASYGTHVFNRMGCLSSRLPGVITEMLIDDRLTTEIIADGRHVHPALLKLLVKNKPDDKIILVTDSVAAMNSQEMRLIKDVYRLENFTLAGSNLTMIDAVKNIIKFCGVTIVQAIRMASLNPAKILGLGAKKGSIAAGKEADLVIFDDKFKVKMTIINGKILFDNL